MQRSQSCSCPLASSDDPACGGVLRVAGGVVAVAERGPGGGVEERERPPEGSIEGGMDLLKRWEEAVCTQRVYRQSGPYRICDFCGAYPGCILVCSECAGSHAVVSSSEDPS